MEKLAYEVHVDPDDKYDRDDEDTGKYDKSVLMWSRKKSYGRLTGYVT